jgi:hypothetical protein
MRIILFFHIYTALYTPFLKPAFEELNNIWGYMIISNNSLISSDLCLKLKNLLEMNSRKLFQFVKDLTIFNI